MRWLFSLRWPLVSRGIWWQRRGMEAAERGQESSRQQHAPWFHFRARVLVESRRELTSSWGSMCSLPPANWTQFSDFTSCRMAGLRRNPPGHLVVRDSEVRSKISATQDDERPGLWICLLGGKGPGLLWPAEPLGRPLWARNYSRARWASQGF